MHQYLTQDAVNAYQPGKKFQIKADPDDTSKVMLYGEASGHQAARSERRAKPEATCGGRPLVAAT